MYSIGNWFIRIYMDFNNQSAGYKKCAAHGYQCNYQNIGKDICILPSIFHPSANSSYELKQFYNKYAHKMYTLKQHCAYK